MNHYGLCWIIQLFIISNLNPNPIISGGNTGGLADLATDSALGSSNGNKGGSGLSDIDSAPAVEALSLSDASGRGGAKSSLRTSATTPTTVIVPALGATLSEGIKNQAEESADSVTLIITLFLNPQAYPYPYLSP